MKYQREESVRFHVLTGEKTVDINHWIKTDQGTVVALLAHGIKELEATPEEIGERIAMALSDIPVKRNLLREALGW